MLGMRWAGVDFRWCSARWPGQGGAGTASRHCIEDESSNNASRIVGQTWPIPTLHPSSPPARTQPSPTIVPVVPTPWIVYRSGISQPLCKALPPDSYGLRPITASLASAAVRPCSNRVRPPDSRVQPDNDKRTDHLGTTYISTCTGRHDTLQALHSQSAVLAKSWVPFLQLMPQLGTKFPLRCCSKRRWTRSALANQQIMQMRAFWPACLSVYSARPLNPFLVLNILTTARRGPRAPCARSTARRKNISFRHVRLTFSYLAVARDVMPPERPDQRKCPWPLGQ